MHACCYSACIALIQIRDVPEDVYETIRRRARRNGQSIQKYMLAQITDIARMADLDEALDELDKIHARMPGRSIDIEQVIADIRSGRQE